jgi:hypothetical protein
VSGQGVESDAKQQILELEERIVVFRAKYKMEKTNFSLFFHNFIKDENYNYTW